MAKSSIYEKVSINIKKYRKLKGMTTEELAIKTGYSHGYIRRLEGRCKKTFSILTIAVVANALDIDIKCLFDEVDI